MDFCSAHFGKPLTSLEISDIKTYFSEERIETDQFEFKSINPDGNISSKFLGIQKTTCAFLNSSGGLIIWGAAEGQKKEGKKEKVYIGDLSYFNTILEKDNIISKISDSIIPLPNGIRVKILSEDNNSIVLIEIDPSEYSPHQNFDTFYMRIDGQTKPAPHHYIEALFKKIKYPNLEAYLKITNIEPTETLYIVSFNIFFFNWSPLQNEEQLSFRVIADGIFKRSTTNMHRHLFTGNGHEFYKENAKDIFYFGEPILESEDLLFDKTELRQSENIGRLIITFGGKFSPRKSCEYFFDFTKVLLNEPNNIVTNKKENILAKDVQDEKGMTKNLIIKSFMEK